MTFRDPVRFKHQKELFVASEGMYSGQVRSDSLGQLQSRPGCWVGSPATAAVTNQQGLNFAAGCVQLPSMHVAATSYHISNRRSSRAAGITR